MTESHPEQGLRQRLWQLADEWDNVCLKPPPLCLPITVTVTPAPEP
jgi:hypothetical protein